jgi:hypothetical protein
MQRHWGWYVDARVIPSPGLFHRERWHYRLWARLEPQRRQRLLAGALLPVAAMTPPQREAWLAALTTPGYRRETDEPRAGAPSPEEVAGGGLTVRQSLSHERLFTRTTPQGRLEALSVSSKMPEELDAAPNQPEFLPHGPAYSLDTYAFSYYLAGRPQPARSVGLSVPRPSRK